MEAVADCNLPCFILSFPAIFIETIMVAKHLKHMKSPRLGAILCLSVLGYCRNMEVRHGREPVVSVDIKRFLLSGITHIKT